jgi:hypothetical protein
MTPEIQKSIDNMNPALRTNYVNQIVRAIQQGYKKGPYASVVGRGRARIFCKLNYMKNGTRVLTVDPHKFEYKRIFHDLFTICKYSGNKLYRDKPIMPAPFSVSYPKGRVEYKENPGACHIRADVEKALGRNTVMAFCMKVFTARLAADTEGAKRKHEKKVIKNRFKKQAIAAAKAGLTKEELVEVIDVAICDDVMSG